MRQTICLLVLAYLNSHSLGAVPTQINHQGVVSVEGQRFSGNGYFYFAIIDPSSGNSIWTNDGSNIGIPLGPKLPVTIPCVNGLYTVQLGDPVLTNMTPILPDVFASENRALRIWFDDGANGIFQLSPDHRLASVPYSMNGNSANGALPITRVYTVHSSWIKPQGLKYVEVEVVGGGGGGATVTDSEGFDWRAGGGGGGGGYAKRIISANALGGAESVLVGSGGNANNNGGTSSFGSWLSASGGLTGGGLAAMYQGGLGGTGSGGDLNVGGGDGGAGTSDNQADKTALVSGNGGSSHYGGGGRGTNIDVVPSNGKAGNNYGGGGGGGAARAGTGIGGAGATGVVIVREYY